MAGPDDGSGVRRAGRRPTTSSCGSCATARPSGAASGQHTGLTDLPLTEHGEQQARAMARPARRPEAGTGAVQPAAPRAGHRASSPGCTSTTIDRRPGRVGLRRLRGHHHRRDPRDGPGWTLWTHGVPGRRDRREVGARADRVLARAAPSLRRRTGRARRARPLQPGARRPLDRAAGQRRCAPAARHGRAVLLGAEHGAPVIAHWNVPNPAARRTSVTDTEQSETTPERRRRGPGARRRRLRLHAAADRPPAWPPGAT